MGSFKIIRHERNHMATTFDFRISCGDSDAGRADRMLGEGHRLVEKLERELSEFLPHSPVFQLNHAPVAERVKFFAGGHSAF